MEQDFDSNDSKNQLNQLWKVRLFRMSDEDYNKLKEKARKKNMRIGDYIRERLNEDSVR